MCIRDSGLTVRMRKVCANLVPINFALEHKDNRMEVCRNLLARIENGPVFLENVITADEPCSFVSFVVMALSIRIYAYRTDCHSTCLPRNSSPRKTNHREHLVAAP